MKLLIIDDSREMVETLSLCIELEWPDADVLSANLGGTGIEMAREHQLDLIILDISMDDMGGLEVLHSIRSFSDVPIVMHSARGNDVEIARFLNAGANDYLVKPVKLSDFIERLTRVMSQTASPATPQ